MIRARSLAPRNPGVQAWTDLLENHMRLAARLQEAFAAFLDHTDAKIGRFVAALEHLGQLDNTLIMLLSDNGASQEGGQFGVMHERKYFNFVLPLDDRTIELIGARERAEAAQVVRGLAGLAGARSADYTPHPSGRHYVYRPPMSPMSSQAGARINGRSWDLDATIERPAGANGVL
ncbi:MAG TPA: sulfatase-like hydrolase/transferase [Streptosporangiaceae bacterium]|nr:sulfatase-like hydrolase/transferase [Streptosporangiaceae bacterium]